MTALHQGWQEMDGSLARTGGWVTGALGVVGIVSAIMWRSRVTEQQVTAESVTTSFFITMAVAESPFLAGFVFTIVSHGVRPFFVGLVLFAVALAIMLVSLGRIDVEADGTPVDVIR